jgi:hypothetical protein
VQAAMGLSKALFCHMTNKAWLTGIQPRWAGTWDLYDGIEGHDEVLEFSLLTSSLSGCVGTAIESNYCSANGFWMPSCNCAGLKESLQFLSAWT